MFYFLISASAPKIKFLAVNIFNNLLLIFVVITNIISYDNILLPSFIAQIWICWEGGQNIFSDVLHWTLQTNRTIRFTHFRLVKLLKVYSHLQWC